MILGLNSAVADYACLWCKRHKEDRWDTNTPMSYYNEEPKRHTLEEIKHLTRLAKQINYLGISFPILNKKKKKTLIGQKVK